MKFSYSLTENFFDTEIAQNPSDGTGIALRFSTRFTPERMSIAYGPVQVKALNNSLMSVLYLTPHQTSRTSLT